MSDVMYENSFRIATPLYGLHNFDWCWIPGIRQRMCLYTHDKKSRFVNASGYESMYNLEDLYISSI